MTDHRFAHGEICSLGNFDGSGNEEFDVRHSHGSSISSPAFAVVCCPGNSMMRAAWGLGAGQGASEAPVSVRILVERATAGRHPKDCGPKGCAENSPTPALLLSCDAQRHRAL